MSTVAHMEGEGCGAVLTYSMIAEMVRTVREQGVVGPLYLTTVDGVAMVVEASEVEHRAPCIMVDGGERPLAVVSYPDCPFPVSIVRATSCESFPSLRDLGGVEPWQERRQGRKKYKPGRGRR